MAAPAKPILLFDSVLDTGTLTASAASGSPETNLIDGIAFTTWSPPTAATTTIDLDAASAVAADAISVIEHDLFSQGALLQVQHAATSDYAGAATVASFSPTSDNPFYQAVTTGSARYWRIRLSNLTAAPYIGHIKLGEHLEMQRLPIDGFDMDAEDSRMEGFENKAGHHSGGSWLFSSHAITAQFRYLTTAWVNSTLMPFLDDFWKKDKGFFLMPDITNYPAKVFYLHAPNNPRKRLETENTYTHWTIEGRGLVQTD